MTDFLSNLQLPSEVEKSILSSVFTQVYVFVIDNAESDNLASFLEKSGYKNILSKKGDTLTTITAQKEIVFPQLNANACASTIVPDNKNCGAITDQDTCESSYQGDGSCNNNCTGTAYSINCGWDGTVCSDSGAECAGSGCTC